MKFTVEDIQFEDDEATEFGTDTDYALDFDSGNDRAQLADVTNATFVHFPRNLGTDLVRGHFAETVDEGKALADDGETYDSIQDAVDAASSWVKVGPGNFNERVVITTNGLTLSGSGNKTIIQSETNSDGAVDIDTGDVTVSDLSVISGNRGVSSVDVNSGSNNVIRNVYVREATRGLRLFNNGIISGCTVENCTNVSIRPDTDGSGCIVTNNIVQNCDTSGIVANQDDVIITYNTVKNVVDTGIRVAGDDYLIGGNVIDGVSGAQEGIDTGNNGIVFNNRVIAPATIVDNGTNTTLDANNTN